VLSVEVVEDLLACGGDGLDVPVVHVGGGHEREAAVVVLVVVVAEEGVGEGSGVLDAGEVFEEVGAVSEGLEVAFGEGGRRWTRGVRFGRCQAVISQLGSGKTRSTVDRLGR